MPVELILRASERLRSFVEFVGRWGAVFILPLVFVTMCDVFLRKIGGMQVYLVETFGRPFESTVIQELEWHFHTALFTLVLGYGMVRNRHVRVDLVRETLSFRKQAWIEFLGVTFFMIPYCLIVGYFAVGFAWDSFLVSEKSASTVGLSYRWIIKSVLVFGLFTAFLSGVAVWLQTVLVLFGPKELRFKLMTLQWPEDVAKASRRLSTGPGVQVDWPTLVRRYVWDEEKTPYLVPAPRLTTAQARSELFVYAFLIAILASVVSVVTVLGRGEGGSPASLVVAVYAATVLLAAIVLGAAARPAAAWYCATAPMALWLAALAGVFRPGMSAGERLALAIASALWLAYAVRVVRVADRLQRLR